MDSDEHYDRQQNVFDLITFSSRVGSAHNRIETSEACETVHTSELRAVMRDEDACVSRTFESVEAKADARTPSGAFRITATSIHFFKNKCQFLGNYESSTLFELQAKCDDEERRSLAERRRHSQQRR